MKRAFCAAMSLTLFPAVAAAESPNSFATRPVAPGITGLSSDIPAYGRHVLVDAASARLFMIENGQVVDSMRVIVGKPDSATPTLRSTIYHATLNPYWNVPVDLARKIIAPRVVKDGPAYLEARGYKVLTKFGSDAQEIDPESVDWQAVADGHEEVYVRQLPGPGNSMGRMKFGFVNNNGIFLHDTPKKELFEEASRQLSNGCVRLEDADRLARWMLGRDPAAEQAAPEQHVSLPQPVHIRITYLDPMAQMQVASLR
jgi:murein L,D-transpeptidase YcbB/YkuD